MKRHQANPVRLPAPLIDFREHQLVREARAALARQALDAATAGAIADCGQPRWPGWQIIIAALIGLQLALLANQALADEQIRPRSERGSPIRVTPTRAGQSGPTRINPTARATGTAGRATPQLARRTD